MDISLSNLGGYNILKRQARLQLQSDSFFILLTQLFNAETDPRSWYTEIASILLKGRGLQQTYSRFIIIICYCTVLYCTVLYWISYSRHDIQVSKPMLVWTDINKDEPLKLNLIIIFMYVSLVLPFPLPLPFRMSCTERNSIKSNLPPWQFFTDFREGNKKYFLSFSVWKKNLTVTVSQIFIFSLLSVI